MSALPIGGRAAVHWSAGYVGLPWLDGGRSADGADCWGLVRLVYERELGNALPTSGESSARELAREPAKKGASPAAPPPPTAAAPAAPPPAMPRTDSAAPAPRAEPRPAEPRAQAAERRPRASAEALELDDAVDQAQREAVALMRQAETSRARGEIEVARRLLAAARAKVMGQPLEGEVLLRAAELELSASAHDQAEAFARAALSVRGFTGRAAAEALLERIRQARGR